MKELNPKQLRFCHEYIIDCNGKQAAIRAGYAPKNAEITASKYLRLSKFSDYVANLQSEVSSKRILTAIEIQEMLSARALGELDALGVKSIDILNKMQGSYVEKIAIHATQKVEYYAPKKNKDK